MDETLKTVLLSFLAILLAAAVAGVVALFSRVRALEAQAAKMATQVEPFWAVVQQKMVKDLTHPSQEFHEADALLAKLGDGTINPAERALLLRLMESRAVDNNPKVGLPERETAAMMAGVMKKVQEEEASHAPMKEVQIVGIKTAEEEA